MEAALLMVLAMLAQPPAASAGEAKPLPAEVCLSNACSDPAKAKPRNAVAVAAGIRRGDYRTILTAGGTAEDVLAAARVRCAWGGSDAQSKACGDVEPGSARLSVFDGRVSLAFTPLGADPSRPGSITKVEMILTEDPMGPAEEVLDQVLPPPRR